MWTSLVIIAVLGLMFHSVHCVMPTIDQLLANPIMLMSLMQQNSQGTNAGSGQNSQGTNAGSGQNSQGTNAGSGSSTMNFSNLMMQAAMIEMMEAGGMGAMAMGMGGMPAMMGMNPMMMAAAGGGADMNPMMAMMLPGMAGMGGAMGGGRRSMNRLGNATPNNVRLQGGAGRGAMPKSS